jgi:hypothetical protein
MGSQSDPRESSSVLCEILRRTLSLVEYYGRLESNESSLFELKLALIRTIERVEDEQAGRASAAKGQEPHYALSSRKAPHSEAIDPISLDKELGKKL